MKILVPNSLLLHTIVLKNRLLFSGPFRKGNITPWERCEMAATLASDALRAFSRASTRSSMVAMMSLESSSGSPVVGDEINGVYAFEVLQ